MKIAVMDGRGVNPGDLSWKPFEELGELSVYDRTPLEDMDELLRRTEGAEVLLINKTPLDRALLTRLAPTLRYVGVLATGYNVVDVQAAKELGITVTNIPSYGTAAVAQYTMALLLELCHRIGDHNRSVQAGDWAACPDFCYWLTPQTELAGKTFGIVGYGRIGKAVAKLASAFGLRVLAYTRSGKGDEFAQAVTLDTLLKESDIISLHCPLFEETRNLIDRENIAKMKDGVMILNTARGPVVNENDLAEALKAGKVRGAAVDVLCQEPARKDNPLIGLENCIVTPHMAWAPLESRQRLLNVAVENLKAWMKGEAQNVVSL